MATTVDGNGGLREDERGKVTVLFEGDQPDDGQADHEVGEFGDVAALDADVFRSAVTEGLNIVNRISDSIEDSWKVHHLRSTKAQFLRTTVDILVNDTKGDSQIHRSMLVLLNLLDYIEAEPEFGNLDSRHILASLVTVALIDTPKRSLGKRIRESFIKKARKK